MPVFAVPVLTLLSVDGIAQLGKALGDISEARGTTASDSEVHSALKQGLTICAANAVKVAGVENGFWGNPAIKIPMPDKMRALEKGLRLAGQGLRIEEFELSMNRAAEAATPAAGPIFAKAIAGLTFSDGRSILNGNNSAGTDFLKRTASVQLTSAFRPIVEAAMRKTGVGQRYEYLATQIKGLTFGQPIQVDIASYVVARTLDGLLLLSSREENKIRSNPETLTDPLLKEVFSKH